MPDDMSPFPSPDNSLIENFGEAQLLCSEKNPEAILDKQPSLEKILTESHPTNLSDDLEGFKTIV